MISRRALGLTLTKPTASFTEFGVKTFRQVEDEVSTGCMQHLVQFVVGGFRLSQKEVITDGTTHQRITLRHKTEITTYLHPALRGFDEAEDYAEERRLADARLTQNGSLRAGLKVV